MSSNQSCLSSPRYGYDYVVATTQASINATMKEFLSGVSEPEVIMCYVMDKHTGTPLPIAYADLVKSAKGTDPFTVPDNADLTSQAIQNLASAYFMYAFKARLGLPPGYAPADMPDIVVMGSNSTSVTYNLLCSEFVVVEAKYGPVGMLGWLNQSQPSGAAWIFTSTVELINITAGGGETLPKAVADQAKKLGNAPFSVQKLLFDLDHAVLDTVPTISGVDSGSDLEACLTKMFLGVYFKTLQKNGKPVLGYSITQPDAAASTLTLTNLGMEVNPFMGANGQPVANPTQQQKDIATLCYLCASGGAQLPPATSFSWNWLDPSESSDYDGVIAINRNTFVKYLQTQLYPYVTPNCYKTSCRCTLDKASEVHYSGDSTANQTPTITYPATGSTVLQFSYSSTDNDQAGKNGELGKITLNSSYNLDVTFSGNQIVCVQRLVFHLYLKHLLNSLEGNIYDMTYTDTFTLAIGSDGQLSASLTSTAVDASQKPKADWFLNLFTRLNTFLNNFETWGKDLGKTSLQDIPLNVAQDFIFPAGNTFTFQSVSFSDNQDLASHITYNQPS